MATSQISLLSYEMPYILPVPVWALDQLGVLDNFEMNGNDPQPWNCVQPP